MLIDLYEPEPNTPTKRRSILGNIIMIITLMNGWRLYRMYAGKSSKDLPEEIDENWDDLESYGKLRTKAKTFFKRARLVWRMYRASNHVRAKMIEHYRLDGWNRNSLKMFLFLTDEEAADCWSFERSKIEAINRGAYIDFAARVAEIKENKNGRPAG